MPIGELLQFGGQLLGAAQAQRERRRDRELAKDQFREQMDHSVRRRVEDAKRAGIHPLFALGASVGGSPTTTVGGPSGSSLGDAVAGLGRNLGRRRMEKSALAQSAAEIRRAEAGAARDEAEAALINSERKRLEQNLVSRGHDGATTVDPVLSNDPVVYGPASHEPPRVMMTKPGKPGVEAGNRPGTIDVMTPDGRKVNIPSPELGLDEVAQVDYIYQRAIHKLSDAFMADKERGDRWKAWLAREWKAFKKAVSGPPRR